MIENFLSNKASIRREKRREKQKEIERIDKNHKKYMPIFIIYHILELFTSYKIASFLSNKKVFIGIITIIVFFYNTNLSAKSLLDRERIFPSFIFSGYLAFLLHFKPEQKMILLKIIIGFIAFNITNNN